MERNARSVERNSLPRPPLPAAACLALGFFGLLQWLADKLPADLPEGPVVGVLVVLAGVFIALTRGGPHHA